jgi:hypothetical protein
MENNKVGFVEHVTGFLGGWRRLTEEAERTLVDNLAATAPWLAPLAPAYLAYQAMVDVLRFPIWVAGTVGMTVEVLGISTINTALTFWTWNREKNKTDKAAPTWLAVLVSGIYVAVVITVNVLLDAGTTLQKMAKALICSLSVAAAITLALRSQHGRRVVEKKMLREEKRFARMQASATHVADTHDASLRLARAEQVSVKVAESKGDLPETYGKWERWPDVPLDEQMKIARMTRAQVVEMYGVGERTAYNWLQYARRDHGLAGEVAKFQEEISNSPQMNKDELD